MAFGALTLGQKMDIPKSSAQTECEAKGGRWDSNTNTCILPEPTSNLADAPKSEPNPPAPQGTITIDADTGKPSGFINSEGKFVKAGKADIDKLVGRQREEAAQLEGATTTEQLIQQRRKLALAKNVGQIDFELASQLEEQGINVRELLHAGVQGIDLKAAAIAAGAGGAAGASAAIPTAGLSIPVTAAIAGGGTLVLDFFNDVRKNIKDQRQDLVRVKTKELRQRKTAMNNYIQAANMNPAEAEDFILAYNIEKSLVMRDYNTLIKRGNEDLEFWGTDATPQIVEYEVFFDSVQPSLDTRMQQAILKPEPTRAFLPLGEGE